MTATTDAQGRFTLRKLSRRAHLRVTAGNYRPAELRPIERFAAAFLAAHT